MRLHSYKCRLAHPHFSVDVSRHRQMRCSSRLNERLTGCVRKSWHQSGVTVERDPVFVRVQVIAEQFSEGEARCPTLWPMSNDSGIYTKGQSSAVEPERRRVGSAGGSGRPSQVVATN